MNDLVHSMGRVRLEHYYRLTHSTRAFCLGVLLATCGATAATAKGLRFGMPYVNGSNLHPVVVLLIINVTLLLVGCVIETLPAIVIFVPTLLLLGVQLGIDPIQFGAVIVLNLMIGLLHPPIGLSLFIVSSVGRVPIGAVMRESVPFLLWSVIVLGLAIVYPPITTWLPSQVR